MYQMHAIYEFRASVKKPIEHNKQYLNYFKQELGSILFPYMHLKLRLWGKDNKRAGFLR